MSNHETLAAALLAAFNLDVDEADPAAVAGAAATVLLAFADAVRGPAPVIGELAAVQEHIDDTPALILAELRNLTTLAEVIAKRGERTLRCIEGASDPICGAAAMGLPG